MAVPPSGVALPAPPSGEVHSGSPRMVGMAEQGDGSGWKSSSRGEKAWKEATERVASRNAEARKAGRVRRGADERGRGDSRPAARGKSPPQPLPPPPPPQNWRGGP